MPPFLIRESSQTYKSKYYHFHKGHCHNINDCIHLKDAIEGLIKRVRLFEYMSGGKGEREESPKGKSPSKVVDVETSGKDKEVSKGKRQYIASIIRGELRANLPSKGTMKRNIVEMLVAHKKRWKFIHESPWPTYIRVLWLREGGRNSYRKIPLGDHSNDQTVWCFLNFNWRWYLMWYYVFWVVWENGLRKRKLVAI